MARTTGALGEPRSRVRELLDTARQSFPDLIETSVKEVKPDHTWEKAGSVYQYTRFETLRGMLGGSDIVDTGAASKPLRELWATSSNHLNDAEEFQRGKAVISDAMQSLPRDAVRTMMRRALNDCNGLDVYCACFSAVPDDLSQWRAYGDNGAGVCLEFDLADLIAGINGVGYWVIYGKPDDESFQYAVAAKLVGYIHSSVHSVLPTSPPRSVLNEVREQLFDIWPALALAFKHSAFQAEREFRVVYSDAVGDPETAVTSFRPDPLVPFVRLGMGGGARLPLRSVRLGPAVSNRLVAPSVRLALKKLGLSNVTVKQSDVPYVPK